VGTGRARHRYCRCGAYLATDNAGRLCANCQRATRDKFIAPPQVPAEFWQTDQLRAAFAAQHIGRVARAYRLHPYHHEVYGPAGISQGLLGQWLGVQQPQISRIENGPPIRDLDTLAYWARLLGIPARMLWFDLPGTARQATTNRDSGADRGHANAADNPSPLVIPSGPNLAALLAAPPQETIVYLREQWHLLVRADNLFGPAHALHLVHEQIELVEALLRDARDDVRPSLLSLGAQYAESAAWLHEDADDQLAAFWTSRALEWAHAGGDHRLVAWALFRRSQQVARDGDAAWSIGLVQAAQNTGGPLPDQMRAALRQQEARGLALDGNEAACQSTLDEALRWAAPEPDQQGDARSGHGAFCTATYIELQRADCWLQLGCPARAVATYDPALADLPAAYNRDRGYGLAQFGSALVATHEPERAANVTREALSIARCCGSGRTMQRIRAVGGSLRPYAKLPAVAWLLDELATAE
jgi:transcriptional regulator with XRE-family HTH domain